MVKLRLYDDAGKITTWWDKFFHALPQDVRDICEVVEYVAAINNTLIPCKITYVACDPNGDHYFQFQDESDVAEFLLKWG